VSKGCIICGLRARSGEHVFPAALGGRRTNKGIYCGAHNNGFSPLAAILSNQLTAINAFLGVRPDHSDEPRQLTTINPSNGEAYLVSALKVELVSPRLVQGVTVDGIRKMQMQFSNEHQFQQWLAEQRAAGLKIETSRGPEGRAYFTQPFHVRIDFGGPEGLKAIGYIALTFLGHYFPQIARQAELTEFKKFVLGESKEQPVWWDFNALPSVIPPNAFRFGHRILIGVSALRQEAYARVSLFSTLDFSVLFGSLRIETDETIIVDIDPQADSAPGDIYEKREQDALATVERPASLHSSLNDTINSGEARNRFDILLQNIFNWQLECMAKTLLPKIEVTNSLSSFDRNRQVKQLLSDHGQLILNQIFFVVNGLKQQFRTDPTTAALVPVLDVLLAEDTTSATGLSQNSTFALELATIALADQVCLDHESGKLDWQRLSLLLGGGLGAQIAGKAVLQPFMMALGITQ
jgi:hypothetical protein